VVYILHGSRHWQCTACRHPRAWSALALTAFQSSRRLPPVGPLRAGRHRMVFDSGSYLAECAALHPGFYASPPFYPEVTVEFDIGPSGVCHCLITARAMSCLRSLHCAPLGVSKFESCCQQLVVSCGADVHSSCVALAARGNMCTVVPVDAFPPRPPICERARWSSTTTSPYF
jgi:hypothetical protein